jgi:CopG family transcriptional regulator / antitoxin EndoAI
MIAIDVHIDVGIELMRTIQMTLDDDLVKMVDQVVKRLHTSRSAFTREALWDAVQKHKTLQLEKKHRQGYLKHPPRDDEFGAWVAEQAWGDE